MNKNQLLNIKKMIFELGCGGSKNHFFDRVNDVRKVDSFFAFAQNDDCENAGKRGRAARNFSRPLLDCFIRRYSGKSPQTGRSMLEMLGVLAIIGVLSVGAIMGFRQAMNRHKANVILNDVSLAFEELATHETTGAISRYQVTAFTPESGHTLYAKRDANGNVSVEVQGVAKGVCEVLIQYDKTELYTQISDTAGAKLTVCTDNQTMVFGLWTDDNDPTPEPEPECSVDEDCADGQVCEEGVCECSRIANCKTQNGTSCACITCEDGFEKNDAGECVEAAAKSCDDGEIITAQNGDEFCKSTATMKWQEAKTWCTVRGLTMPRVEEMCENPVSSTGVTLCENLKIFSGADPVLVWSASESSSSSGYVYVVDCVSADVAAIPPEYFTYYAICK